MNSTLAFIVTVIAAWPTAISAAGLRDKFNHVAARQSYVSCPEAGFSIKACCDMEGADFSRCVASRDEVGATYEEYCCQKVDDGVNHPCVCPAGVCEDRDTGSRTRAVEKTDISEK
ncbi:hypothetical protein QBC44DRAFT_306442 [Cladorrhinum sp. PSN332]|nr:hypothetical protein QBC44DRAFT_306442 [Cladorrhinum sp. PSN332]